MGLWRVPFLLVSLGEIKTVAILAGVNLPDRLVLLEDGRELPITQFYRSFPPLKAGDELREEHRIDSYDGADIFTVDLPGGGGALIVEIAALGFARPQDVN